VKFYLKVGMCLMGGRGGHVNFLDDKLLRSLFLIKFPGIVRIKELVMANDS
jgi:hypothetical protein